MNRRDPPPAAALALSCDHARAARAFEHHHEIELLFLDRGRAVLAFGNDRIQLRAGDLALCWGLLPHRVEKCAAPARLARLCLPLATFLRWPLPEIFQHRVLRGEVIVERGGLHARTDAALFRAWAAELVGGSPETQRIVLLEAEARVRRMAFRCGTADAPAHKPAGGAERVIDMARFIAESHTEPLHIADIARHAHVNAHHAERLFCQSCGVSLHGYLQRHRLAHAQWLLATTDATVIEIALEAGFGSLSRCYAAFARDCSLPPLRYREEARSGKTRARRQPRV